MAARRESAPTPSLDEFAAEDDVTKPGYTGACDLLPADIQEQLLTSRAGHAQAERWLASLGYDIRQQIIGRWRRDTLRKRGIG